MKKFFQKIGKGIERLLTKAAGNLSELLEQQNQIIRLLKVQNDRLRLELEIAHYKCREYEKQLLEIVGSFVVPVKIPNLPSENPEAGFAFIAYPEVLNKIRSEALAAMAELDIENCDKCEAAAGIIDGIIGKVNAAIGPPKSPGLNGFKTEDDGGD